MSEKTFEEVSLELCTELTSKVNPLIRGKNRGVVITALAGLLFSYIDSIKNKEIKGTYLQALTGSLVEKIEELEDSNERRNI